MNVKANFFIKNDIIHTLEFLLKIEFCDFIYYKKSTDFTKG